MPSKSPAQKRLMAAVAHDPKFAKKVGIQVSVGKDFFKADQNAAARRNTLETAMKSVTSAIEKSKIAKGHKKAR